MGVALFKGLIYTGISIRLSAIKVINRDTPVRLLRVDTIANLMLFRISRMIRYQSALYQCSLLQKNVTNAIRITEYNLISVTRYFEKIKIVQWHFTW